MFVLLSMSNKTLIFYQHKNSVADKTRCLKSIRRLYNETIKIFINILQQNYFVLNQMSFVSKEEALKAATSQNSNKTDFPLKIINFGKIISVSRFDQKYSITFSVGKNIYSDRLAKSEIPWKTNKEILEAKPFFHSVLNVRLMDEAMLT
jgi:hypothetical protein